MVLFEREICVQESTAQMHTGSKGRVGFDQRGRLCDERIVEDRGTEAFYKWSHPTRVVHLSKIRRNVKTGLGVGR